MGRYVRAVLRDLATRPDLDVTLLVRDVRNAERYREIVPGADVAALVAARTRVDFAAIWYPWNGIRFAARAPAVVTINDDFAFRYPAAGRVARWREQRPIRRAAERATHFMTISEWSRGALVERFGLNPERISVIPLAPDPMFVPGTETSPYLEPFVLAVGSGEARKNLMFLVDVMARAFPAGDVRLVIVGQLDAAQRRRYRERAVLVTECSGIGDEQVRRLYRTAAAVAVPSLAEGFGLVAVEAQACGAAVIAANGSALPEAVGIAAILIDPLDGSAWTTALRDLVRNAALNAYYRAQSAARWPAQSRDGTTDAVRAVLQRAIDDRV